MLTLKVEAKLYALEEVMTEQGYSAEEVAKRVAAERRRLEASTKGPALLPRLPLLSICNLVQ